MVALTYSVFAFNLKAIRSLERRLGYATFGSPSLRNVFLAGANPSMCSAPLESRHVSAAYERARWAAPIALRGLDVSDLMWKAATVQTTNKDQTRSKVYAKQEEGWVTLSSDKLPFFCSVGEWQGLLLVVYRSTASESEALQGDLGGAFTAQYGYADVLRLLHNGIPVPFPPQVTLDGKESASNDVPKVHAGFWSAYVESGLESDVWRELEKRLQQKRMPLAILGHSLGAGVAAVCVAKSIPRLQLLKLPNVYLILTACPKPGNTALQTHILRSNVECICYANEADPVPWLPFSTMPNPISKDGMLEYTMLPGTFLLSRSCPSLLLSHSSMTYRGLLAGLAARK